jgi:hypothetical protein
MRVVSRKPPPATARTASPVVSTAPPGDLGEGRGHQLGQVAHQRDELVVTIGREDEHPRAETAQERRHRCEGRSSVRRSG